MQFRKPPTKSEVVQWLRQGRLELPPVRFQIVQTRPPYDGLGTWDFEVAAVWGDQSARFAVEYKSLSTPKVFAETIRACVGASLPAGCYPLILMPYLRPDQLSELERQSVSGVDCCGNGVLMVPGGLRVFRTGAPNRFSTSSPIKNIYRKNTSMVARALLTISRFANVQEVLAQVNRCNVFAEASGATPMTLGTVSKALKQMEEELLIVREQDVRLLQPEKLLDNLRQNFELPKAAPRVRLKVDCDFDQLPRYLTERLGRRFAPLVATGLASVSRYAVMQREEILSLYGPNVTAVQHALAAREAEQFPNLDLIETAEQPLYFDARKVDGFHWASPVQTYLELMSGDKRDRETAEQVKDYLLRQLGGGD